MTCKHCGKDKAACDHDRETAWDREQAKRGPATRGMSPAGYPISAPRNLRDILSVPVKEAEIGQLLEALNGFEELQLIVRRMAYQRDLLK